VSGLSPWRMASATPDLRLPFQPRGITAFWPVPNYTAWWQRHMWATTCLRSLPGSVPVWSRTCALEWPQDYKPGTLPLDYRASKPVYLLIYLEVGAKQTFFYCLFHVHHTNADPSYAASQKVFNTTALRSIMIVAPIVSENATGQLAAVHKMSIWLFMRQAVLS